MHRKIKPILKGLTLSGLAAIFLLQPLNAEVKGPLREQMEYYDFSERIIRNGLYAKSSHDTFNKNRRAFVHGIKVHNAPRIYEPDVYTWELAVAEHRKELARLAPPPMPQIVTVAPSVMVPPPMLPTSPTALQLTPVGPYSAVESPPMPANSMQEMNKLIYRARQRGIYPQNKLRATEIKNQLVNHINSLDGSVPALMPALPSGTRQDSHDSEF